MTSPLLPIGWTERVDLPVWGIRGLRAKVDTGARTSAIHVADLRELGDGRVIFHVVLSREDMARRIEVIEPVVRKARVRSSNGDVTRRIFVRTTLVLGPVAKRIEVTLVCRRQMRFRMLIGRSALEGDFLVDVSRRDLTTLARTADPTGRSKGRKLRDRGP